jgi:hypothetical protein
MACHGDIYNDEQPGFIDLSDGEAPQGYSEVGLVAPATAQPSSGASLKRYRLTRPAFTTN